MTSQAVHEVGPGQRTARNILLGIPPRMFQEVRTKPAGATLARASHPQFGTLSANSGDRIYLCAFSDGKLALVGRLVLDPGRTGDARRGSMVGRAPFTACRADRIVPHQIARELRSISGDSLRFARAFDYELHPGALLRPVELEPESAEALDSLLTETPSSVQVALTAGGVERPVLARRSRSRSDALAERDRSILELAGMGALYSEIAERFGISRQRVSQIIRAGEHRPEVGERAARRMSPAEMLDVHAALVEARAAAATRGERQGATRRIRTIEAALLGSGVEFEPAAFERQPRRSTRKPSTPEELLAAHAAQIEARAAADTPGTRAGATKRIRNIEAALRERGVEFEPAEFERPPRRSQSEPSTSEELLAVHAALVEARAAAGTRGERQGATRRIRKIEAVLRERGVEFEPAALERRPRRVAPMPSTPEELLAAHAVLVEARMSAGTRGERQGATRRIRSVESALRERGVEFEPAALERRPRRSAPMPSTPDELLAAHAAWVEARESAQTGGERQGASRRIRNIERVLRERGVEFEQAAFEREPRRSVRKPSTSGELLAAHAAQIEARESAGTPGTRAGATKRIRNIESALRDRGVEFEPATFESDPKRSAPMPSTPEELLAAHAVWVEARAAAGTRRERQGATLRIRNIEAALRDRGVEFEPATFERDPRRSAPMPSTPEELLAAHAAQIEARASAGTPGTRAGATKRIRNIEAALRERGVEFEPAAFEQEPSRSVRKPSTPDELLAAHAAQIEARESADTPGTRAGATKRIRNIESALRERGVEFEPAKFERDPRRSAPMPSTPEELLAAQAAQIDRASPPRPTPPTPISTEASATPRPRRPPSAPDEGRLQRLGKISYRRVADALKRPPKGQR